MQIDVILDAFSNIVGSQYILTDADDLQFYGVDRCAQFSPSPIAIVFPKSIDEIQQLVQYAMQHSVALVPSGGRTGLSGGACAINGEVVVSMEKMNRIHAFNETDRLLKCEAGVITQAVQEFAEEQGLFFPIDLASAGSSQIGGNVATNAGGSRVIRYGMIRNWVKGLTVVTGKGEVLELNRGLRKNNSGYDLMQLFIGSEGTLGIIAEVELMLCQKPNTEVMLLTCEKLSNVVSLFEYANDSCVLNAFEYFTEAGLNHVMAYSECKAPFATASPYYVLLEIDTGEPGIEPLEKLFSHAVKKAWVTDGITAKNDSDRTHLWQYRELISESIAARRPLKFDVVVKPSCVERFVDLCHKTFTQEKGFHLVDFGHIGDGNIHLNILPGTASSFDDSQVESVYSAVVDALQHFQGSFSAEHGIGLTKKKIFAETSADKRSLCAEIKPVFDPAAIMNPGKII